ncbi:NAD kinase [Weeksellaceae bacterium KMM 9713]|uniref:NAD kinase n=1 Tax=Profundicola chukchiensis TaxID=2961959 RepID=A0A9X4MZX5_9FLAO|nr:NAD kinase [Profundicola chukchiensis]MDG4945626.1 NAD kinase [Profundicola chukchiensis]MDG4949435.1 NAD kinase [Profundicola chukchiensis]
MKVAIYGMQFSEALEDFMPELLDKFREKEVEFQVEEKFLEILKFIKSINLENVPTFKSHEDMWDDLDLFFTFGGDGTILSAITIVQDSNVPMVGVNTGRLGYLAGINKKEILPYLDDILAKNFKISRRSLVKIHSPGLHLKFPFALNEVTLMRKETTSMITIDAYIDGQLVNSFWADGLIISTPTGSTGYSLSCNGPIISPETENFVITPMAPHNLNVRPLVIQDSVEIRLIVHSRVPKYSLSLDNRLDSIDVKHEICVSKADFMVNIVQLNHSNYLETLRQKLFWGIDRRN